MMERQPAFPNLIGQQLIHKLLARVTGVDVK